VLKQLRYEMYIMPSITAIYVHLSQAHPF